MGRETYTFTLNHQKLSTTLADKLEAEMHGEVPFGDYVAKAELELDEYVRERFNRIQPLTAEEIIHVLRTEPERADLLHLTVPFDWLWDFFQIGNNGGHTQIWSDYGYDLVYELRQKDKCWVYMHQLGNYEYYIGIEDDYEKQSSYASNYTGNYHIYENSTYKNALKYLLMLLRKLWQDGRYSKDMSHYTYEELALATDHTKDDRLEKDTDKQLQILREQSENKQSHEYNVADHMFFQIKEVQQLVQGYEGTIFIWDSY